MGGSRGNGPDIFSMFEGGNFHEGFGGRASNSGSRQVPNFGGFEDFGRFSSSSSGKRGGNKQNKR